MENQMNQLVNPLAMQSAKRVNTSIGSILLDMGKITAADAERILKFQKEKGMRFGEAAQILGLISEADIDQVLARQFDYPYLLSGEGSFPPGLIAAYEPFSPQVETLRAIRSQLMLRWFAEGQKSLVVASVMPDESASMFVANLAVVFSQLGEKTLLVDANLREPSQHRVFNIRNRQGLSDVLAERADMDVITRVEPFIDLSVLQAGTLPPNPLELVSRASFTHLNARVAHNYDVVLYDVSPFSVSADALAVATNAGGVLLTARKHKTRLADINAACDQLARYGVDVVGSVLLDI
jgi:chain length determinant protein tyrosine kinase EpsG